MKKLFPRYKKYMFHPILYKCVTRVSVVAVLMLLWDRYVSDGTFTMWQAPALLLGVILLAWAWVDYLRLDGVTIHHLAEEFKEMGKKIGALICCAEEKQAEVRAFITGLNRTLPLYQRITAVEFSAEPLPRNAMGKLLRR